MRTLAVIRREYLERVRSKSFLVGLILGPVIMSMFVVVPAMIARSNLGEQRTIGVIDPTGRLVEPLRSAVGDLQRERPGDRGQEGEAAEPKAGGGDRDRGAAQSAPPQARRDRFLLMPISVEGRSLGEAVEELRQMIRKEQIHSGIVFDKDFVRTGKVSFYSKSVSGVVVRGDLNPAVNRVLREQRFALAGVPDSLQSYLSARADWSTVAVTVEGEAAQKSEESPFMVAIVLIMILYMMVLTYGAHTLTAVIEEKSSRVYEVLLSSVAPGQLMFGKVLGIGLAGLTQTGIWTLAFYSVAQRGISFGSFTLDASMLTPVIWLSFLVFFLLGFFLYALIFAGVGAMCETTQDAQQFNFPIMMGLVLPMLLLSMVLQSPNSPVAVVLSLIPMVSPVLMFMRVCVQTPPMWQIGLSWALMLGAIWLTSRMAGKLFRLGILMHGASPTWGTLARALRQS